MREKIVLGEENHESPINYTENLQTEKVTKKKSEKKCHFSLVSFFRWFWHIDSFGIYVHSCYRALESTAIIVE